MNVQEQIQDVATKLDALLRIRYAAETDDVARGSLVARYIVNELRRWQPGLKHTSSLVEAVACAHTLSTDAIAIVRKRCLFYGCDDLISLLVRKRIKGDAIAREEAVLYVQDRLQRDDFRRIDTFQADRGASFVTYMWQVINNLLLDFLRVHGRRAQREQGNVDHDTLAATHVEAGTEGFASDELGRSHTQAEGQVEAMQLRELLAAAMNEPDDANRSHPLRARLREHLHLASKERVLLKAMFQYDMTVAEICELPGFEMSAGEVYRSYYRIMDRLTEAFKHAGLTETLRSLVSNVAPRVTVSVDGEESQVSANRIYYLLQDGRRTTCHLQWRGGTHAGAIADSFAKLCKRLGAYFSPIDSMTALSDILLAATYRQWSDGSEIVIAGVQRRFRIGVRYIADLQSRFARKRDEKPSGSLV